MKSKIEQLGLKWKVESAGTGSWHVGEQPDERAIEIMRKYKIDITYQRARQFSPYDFEHFDLIFAMDSANYNDILKLAQSEEEKKKVRLILNESLPDSNSGIPDPYYDDNGFEQVFQLLDKAGDAIIKKYAVRV